MKSLHWYLAPRYCAGSPSAVWNEALARRIVRDEKESYEHTLEGVYGPQQQERAQQLGLSGIVEERTEYKNGWKVLDLITGRRFYREKKLASKVRPGDIITAYEPLDEPCVTGRFKVVEVSKWKDRGCVILRLGDKDTMGILVGINSEVTTEKDEVL
jgi:hypothetical protein